MAVLLCHVFIQLFPYSPDVAVFLAQLLPFSGAAAVYIFFVISGFALSTRYVRTQDSEGLAQIAASRYLRLALPIFAGCSIIHLFLLTGLIPEADLRPAPWSDFLRFEPTIRHLLQFSFFDVFFRFSEESAYILPLWTMSIELYGSIGVFVLLAMCGCSQWRVAFYVVACVALLPTATFSPTLGFFSLFIGGMILAELHARWMPRFFYQYAILGVLLIFGALAPYLASHRPTFTYFAGMIAFCSAASWLPWSRAFLENRLSRRLGKISFPLYLTHGPVLWSFSYWAFDAVSKFGFNTGLTNTITALLTLPVALVAAWVFEPINRLSMVTAGQFGRTVVAFAKTVLLKPAVTDAIEQEVSIRISCSKMAAEN